MVVRRGYLVASTVRQLVGYVFEVDYDTVQVQPLSMSGRWELEYVPLSDLVVVAPVFAPGELVCPAEDRDEERPRWGRVVAPGDNCLVAWSDEKLAADVEAVRLRSLTISQSVALGVS